MFCRRIVLKNPGNIYSPSNVTPVRFTWVLKHALDLPTTAQGAEQRPPTDKFDFQKYKTVGVTTTKRMNLVPVVLTKTVPGIGKGGEVIEIRSHTFRDYYQPAGLAVYATEYNIKKYEHLKLQDEGKDQEPHEKYGILKSEYDLFVYVNSKAIPILLNLEQPWTLEKWHIRSSLRMQDVLVSDKQIVINNETVSGPNLKLQNKLFRFYIVVNKRIVMPCLGRYTHVTTKTYKQMLTPSLPDPTALDADQMDEAGLIEEDLYIHPTELPKKDDFIWDIMQKRMQEKREKLKSSPQRLTQREQAALEAEAKAKRDVEIAELQKRTFTWYKTPKVTFNMLSKDEQNILTHKIRRNRNWDDYLHNWLQPIGKPKKRN